MRGLIWATSLLPSKPVRMTLVRAGPDFEGLLGLLPRDNAAAVTGRVWCSDVLRRIHDGSGSCLQISRYRSRRILGKVIIRASVLILVAAHTPSLVRKRNILDTHLFEEESDSECAAADDSIGVRARAGLGKDVLG